MRIDPGTHCPLLNKTCIKLRCAWFTKLAGVSKNTGQPVDEWGCAVAWLPMLLIETAGEARQTAAAVESLRNVTVKSEDATRAALIAGLGLFDGPPLPAYTQIEDKADGGPGGP